MGKARSRIWTSRYMLLLSAGLFLGCSQKLFGAANASVTAATGGGAISADAAGGTYTTLTGPILKETDKTGIGVGSIILSAPEGFEFNPAATVRVAVTGRGKGSDLVLSNSTAVVTTNTITVYVAAASLSIPRRSTLTWSGIKVRPKLGWPLATGNITKSGTSSYSESGSAGNYGTLREVPGTLTKLVVRLPPQTFTAGSGVSGMPGVQTSGVPFNITALIAADRFTNIVTNYQGVSVISYAGPGGSPSYTTNVTFTNGQSTTTLATTLRKAETTTIYASTGTTGGPPSSAVMVSPGPFARFQLLLPGETAAPGTSTGKSGTPSAQTAGMLFTGTVRAVDADWNLVGTVTDVVGISSSDTNAILPSNTALSAGTGEFALTMKTAGTQTITVTNVTVPSIGSDTSSVVAVECGGLQKLQLLVPGETAEPGTVSGKTGIPAAQVAGSCFTATVHAVDEYWNVVPVADYVGISASDNGAVLPANAALSSGAQTFVVTLGTAGLATLTATDLSNVSTISNRSPPITVMAGPFARLQILTPGETAAPATVTGKTGIPLPHSAGVSFPVTVSAVDDMWNPVGSITDTVHFTSSDLAAVLPADAPLAGGTGVFTVALNTVGSQTITVSDVSDVAKGAGTSSVSAVDVAISCPATGGDAIPADRTGGAYTTLIGPTIMEAISGNVGTGTILLTIPTGFVVNTGNTVMVNVTGSGVGTDLVLASSTATVSTTTISVTVNAPSTGSRASTLTWSGIQVRPSAGTPLAGGQITNSGSSVIAGIPSGSNLGLLTETAGTAVLLSIQTQPSATATAGSVFAQQPVLEVRDQFGNRLTNDHATVATASRGSGAGTLQGTVSAIANDGEIAFTNIYHCVADTISLDFSSAGLVGATSSNIVVNPAAASQLVFVQPPSDAVAGAVISPDVTIQVEDAFSNHVPSLGMAVSVVVGSGTGYLSGTTTNLTSGSGLATFSGLSIASAGAKTLVASTPGLTQAVSAAFTISPAAASQLVFVQSPTDTEAGATIAPVVTVQLRDAFGNDTADAGVSVTMSLTTGTGLLGGTTPRVTDSRGLATFDDLSIAVAGPKGLTATGIGVTEATSDSFTIVPGAYASVQILVPGETAAPGTVSGKTGMAMAQLAGTPFTVRVNGVDASWNVVDTVSNTITVYSSTDVAATFSPDAALVAGTNSFTVTLNTAGNQTVAAEDVVNLDIPADTSPEILVATTTRTLRIISAHGTTSPAIGLYTNPSGATLVNTANSPDTLGGTQYVCTGWVMAGNEPANGTTTNLTMTLTNNATLTWTWGTNVQLSCTAGPNGSVPAFSNAWCALGGNVTVTGVPAIYYHFDLWSGDVPPAQTNVNPLTLTMDRMRSIGASFAVNMVMNKVPQWWLAQYGLSTNDAGALYDEGDGMPAWQEYLAGTDPTNQASVLGFTAVTRSGGKMKVTWRGGTDVTQYLERCTVVTTNPAVWTPIFTNTPPMAVSTNVFDPDTSVSRGYYRIRAVR